MSAERPVPDLIPGAVENMAETFTFADISQWFKRNYPKVQQERLREVLRNSCVNKGPADGRPWMVKDVANGRRFLFVDEQPRPPVYTRYKPEIHGPLKNGRLVEGAPPDVDALTRAQQRRADADGQGRALSAEQRRVIEQHAMERAKSYYRSLGYEVDDVSTDNPYDLLARKSGQELQVEVKGTSTAGERVILTRNEVRHARAHKAQVALFVLSDIKITDDRTEPTASGGEWRELRPWDVDAGHLDPRAYDYSPPW